MDVSDEIRRRWTALGEFLVSPVNGRKLLLREQEGQLKDEEGSSFPFVQGVPVLMPHLEQLMQEHFEVSRQAGPPPEELLLPREKAISLARKCAIKGYLFGYPLKISELQMPTASVRAPSPPPVGSILLLQNDRLAVQTRAGALEILRFELDMQGWKISTVSEFLRGLRLDPPFFLLRDRFPVPDLVTLHELLPFPGNAAVPAFEVDSGFDPSSRELAEQNEPYFRWLFRAFDSDVDGGVFLDLGCCGGWLAASLSLAGARHVIGTDLRKPSIGSFLVTFPECENVFLGMADMFRWCYARDAYSLIVVRNNTAFCFASSLDSRFVEFGRNCAESLRPDGLFYLSFLTDGSRIETYGYQNLSLPEIYAFFRQSGLKALKLMKLGTMTGFLACREEGYEQAAERARRTAARQRTWALREYFLDEEGSDQRVLNNCHLALSDFACEIVHELHRRSKKRVCFWGGGILGYYLHRILDYQFPSVPRVGFVLPRRTWNSIYRTFSPDQARENFGSDCLHVLADTRTYRKAVMNGSVGVEYPHPIDLQMLDDAMAPSDEVAETGWRYHLVSGDHDSSLPSHFSRTYLRGRLSLLAEDFGKSKSALAFERKYFHDFPKGYLLEPIWRFLCAAPGRAWRRLRAHSRGG